jgi:hypothetical protein
MTNATWIERPVDPPTEIAPEEAALRETFLAASKIGWELQCAGNSIEHSDSPEVTACAAVARAALQKPENQRAHAAKEAELKIRQRLVSSVSRVTSYREQLEAWDAILPTLVSQLEAVAIPNDEAKRRRQSDDVNLLLNCQAVATLIDECQAVIDKAIRKDRSPAHAEKAFQKAFDDLVAEVTEPTWLRKAAYSCHSYSDTNIFDGIPLDGIFMTRVPAELVACSALFDAQAAFRQEYGYDTHRMCRDFQENTRGTFQDSHLSERLLAAMPDVAAMQRVEAERDRKLCGFERNRRSILNRVEKGQALFRKTVELFPAAVAEVAGIKDELMRKRAQNLCLFTAHTLRSEQTYIRECEHWVGFNSGHRDIVASAQHEQAVLIDRLKNKRFPRQHGRCCG